MAISFISRMCSMLITSLLPVVVMNTSALSTTSSSTTTSKPSIAACNAQIGSTSVTLTRAPAPRSDAAEPLPTSPYPQTTAVLPAIIVSVARRMPSTRDSLQPYLLSNLDLVTESFTLIAGNGSWPFFTNSYRRCTPVVVSSDTPLIASRVFVNQPGDCSMRFLICALITASSSDCGTGMISSPASARAPNRTYNVASPPSSKIMFGPSGNMNDLSK